MLEAIIQRVERWLILQGFNQAATRRIIRNQIFVSLGTSLVIVLITLFSRWSAAYAAGAILALVNFWTLTRVVQSIMHSQKGGPFTLFLIFMAKMTLSGVALYWLIGVERVPHWGLISGIATVPVNLTVTGLIQAGNTKPSL